MVQISVGIPMFPNIADSCHILSVTPRSKYDVAYYTIGYIVCVRVLSINPLTAGHDYIRFFSICFLLLGYFFSKC